MSDKVIKGLNLRDLEGSYFGQGAKPKPRPGFIPWPGLPAPWSQQFPAVDPTMLDV